MSTVSQHPALPSPRKHERSLLAKSLKHPRPLLKTGLFETEWLNCSSKIPPSEQKVMIVLHGRGDSLKAFRSIDTELALPKMNYLLLNAPEKFGSGFSWYKLEPNHRIGVLRARDRLVQLVEALRALGWATENIFWLGHSQGCLVAADLILNHPATFGGLVGVSGYVWFFRGWKSAAQKSGALKTPWLLTHGTRDRIIKPAEIRADVRELERGAIPVTYREFQKGHDFDFTSEVPFIRSCLGRWLRVPRQSRRFAL